MTDGYRVVWADEFKSGPRPDPTNWVFENGLKRNEEAQLYQEANARIERGKLVIEARRERVAIPGYKPGSDRWNEKSPFAEYTSASLTTEGKHSWLYGRFEMRARIDTRLGLWPAFWTLGAEREWPQSGEIDIMEFYRGKLLANVAWATERRWTAKWASTSTPLEKLGNSRWASKFHLWRMDWDEEKIELSVDGKALNRLELAKAVNPDGFNPFHQPHYLLLNLAVGGQNGGDPSGTEFPAKFEVDFVRVSQKV